MHRVPLSPYTYYGTIIIMFMSYPVYIGPKYMGNHMIYDMIMHLSYQQIMMCTYDMIVLLRTNLRYEGLRSTAVIYAYIF